MVDDIVKFSVTQLQGGLQLLLTCYDLVDQMGQCINAVKKAEFSLDGIKLSNVTTGIMSIYRLDQSSCTLTDASSFFLKYDGKIKPEASFDLRTPPRMC